MKLKYAGIRYELPRRLAALTATTALAGAVFLPTQAEADAWYSIHPADCQAPFLSQAGPMRWHEHYLFNPKDNGVTYVVCPVTIDAFPADFSPGFSTYVFAAGAVGTGASTDVPQCFLAAAGRNNLAMDSFVDVPGGAQTFVAPLVTTPQPPRWSAAAFVNNDAIRTATASDRFDRNHAIFCRLPPGYGISLLGLYVQ